MTITKTLTDRTRRLLALLSAGVLFFVSCDYIELRNADPTETPVRESETVVETPAETDAEQETDAAPPAETETPETETPPSVDPVDPPAISLPVSEEAAVWIARYEDAFGEGSADALLLTAEEIADYNRRTTDGCDTLVDILNVPESVSGEELRDRIARLCAFASDERVWYDADGNAIQVSPIRANCAEDGIPETVEPKTAVAAARCDMKALPTPLGFYAQGDAFYSDIQLTELIVGMPLWVLHESADGAFYYAQSYYYEGWIPAEAAAFCDGDEFRALAEPENFVTVVVPEVASGETVLNMGAAFPVLEETEDGWLAAVPARDEDGTLSLREQELSRGEAVPGRVPYTMKNYYAEAFAYLGTPYGWGGADGGVDCSSFVCAVFRAFGIFLPRDTKDQKDFAGSATPADGLDAGEIDSLLDGARSPVSLYSPGHVMLYLGRENGVHTVIHAPQGGEFVAVAPLAPERQLISIVEMK